jgi:hypothetical protein
VIDQREKPESACVRRTECQLVQQGCCGSCGGDPSLWLALSTVREDPYPETRCAVDCAQCNDSSQPEPFCADDGHCAVRELATVAGVPSTTCYSPTQNLDRANEASAVGCDCSVSGFSLCVRDPTVGDVALMCDGQWQVIQDGPCGV